MVKWFIDAAVIYRLTQYNKDLREVIEQQGHSAIPVVPNSIGQYEISSMPTNEPIVLYGSHLFVKTVLAKFPELSYAGFGVNENTLVSSYMSNLPIDWFINNQAIFMTWAMLKARGPSWFSNYKDGIFVRPNSGFKTFAGRTLMFDKWNEKIELIEDVSSVSDSTMILVSPLSKIIGEYRFVACNGKVVTGSQYRRDNVLDIRIDYPQECYDLAATVAKHNWQVDRVYTVDIGLLDSGPKIVELNGFSCAGLYACNLQEIVDAVSAEAQNAFDQINNIK